MSKMSAPTKKELKDTITRLEREGLAMDITIQNLRYRQNEIHQAVMDTLKDNRDAFVSQDALSDVAHKVGNAIRGASE